MRPVLPLLLAALAGVAPAAEYQRLTFSDGTTRTGYFNERTGALTLDDGSTITVRIDDIIRREPIAAPANKRPDQRPAIPPPVLPPADAPRPGGTPSVAARNAAARWH